MKKIYSGSYEEFSWVGFGSGTGSNLRECAKIIRPALIFSDRENAPLLGLQEFYDVPKITLNGYNICGSFQKAKGDPAAEQLYEKRSFEYNEQIRDTLFEFEKQEGITIDLIVLGGYMRLLKEPVLERYADKIINVHPSDLAIRDKDNKRVYTGMDSVYDAIVSGESSTRSSTIMVNSGVDNGEILTRGPKILVPNEYRNMPDNNLMEYIESHQDLQKKKSDWPSLTTALELIAQGRLSLGQPLHHGKWRTVYLDGHPLDYGGVSIDE